MGEDKNFIVSSIGKVEESLNRLLPYFKNEINKINNEAALAGKSDAIFMTSLSKGGIYKALWDIGEKCGTGLTVELKSIPIKQETVEICEVFDINPYEFSLLINLVEIIIFFFNITKHFFLNH